MKKQILTAVLAGVFAPALLSTATAGNGPGVNAQLAAVRAATADFHQLETAQAVGWDVLATGCISVPGVGGMGYHYVNEALVADPVADPELPEVLVYAPAPSGGLRLVAVEWLVPVAISPTPPSLFGETFHFNPVVQAWVLHAWIWKHNPNGIFQDFNPTVSCTGT